MVRLLTVIPVPWGGEGELTRSDVASAVPAFPLAGAVQGLILVTADYAFSFILPAGVRSALILIALVLTNGGFHLDGFADTVDGLAGGATPEDRLRIMRDSRVGAVGVVSVALILLLKYAALTALPPEIRSRTVFLFPVVGRWAMVPMACWGRYARKEGGLGAYIAGAPYSALAMATAVTAVFLFLLSGPYSLTVIPALLAAVWLTTLFFRKRLGGVTGDVLGFQSEVAEALFLLMALAMKGPGAGFWGWGL